MSKEKTIYNVNDNPDSAYMLKKGKVKFNITQNDIIKLEGENRIFGVVEVVLSYVDKFPYFRMFSAKADDTADISKVSKEQLIKSLENFNIGYRINKELALLVRQINKIYSKLYETQSEEEIMIQGYSRIYYNAITKMLEEFEDKRFPWLEELVNKSKSSMIFAKGQSYISSDSELPSDVNVKVVKDELSKEYPPGAVICEEGSLSTDMFILVSGKLKLLVNDRLIAYIDTPGEAIGETSLFLGEPGFATIKAVENSVVTTIKKNELKRVFKIRPKFFFNLSVSLSRRIIGVMSKINDLCSEKKDSEDGVQIKEMEVFGEDFYRTQVKELKSEIKNLYDKYEMEWLYEIVDKITDDTIKLQERG